MKRNSSSDISPKNQKYMPKPSNDELSESIVNILQCNVCLELPKPDEFYLCPFNHILCDTCALRLLSDASKRNKKAKCPSCRRSISYEEMVKQSNHLIMKIILELPKKCPECNEQCKVKTFDNHIKNECLERLTNCSYRRIGCHWIGPYRLMEEHHATCAYPHKNASELVEDIHAMHKNEESNLMDIFMFLNLKNSESIHFQDLELQASFCSQTRRLLIDSGPFSAFDETWTIRVQSTRKRNAATVKRKLKYRVLLNSRPRTKLLLGYYLMESPSEKLQMEPEMHRFTFSNQIMKSGYKVINLTDSNAVNKVLAKKTTTVRIAMFINYHEKK